MQLELSPAIEQALERESKLLGITSTELSAQVLAKYANDLQVDQRTSVNGPLKSGRTIEQYVEWMKSGSPDYDTADPRSVDWQAIRAEGRKY